MYYGFTVRQYVIKRTSNIITLIQAIRNHLDDAIHPLLHTINLTRIASSYQAKQADILTPDSVFAIGNW